MGFLAAACGDGGAGAADGLVRFFTMWGRKRVVEGGGWAGRG